MDTSPAPASTPTPEPVVVRRPARSFAPYVPAIGPKLRVLLLAVFGLFAFLGATGIYLAAVTLLNYTQSPISYTTPFAAAGCFSRTSRWACWATAAVRRIWRGHWLTAHKRQNRVAVRLGIVLFFAGSLVCLSGFALVQLDGLPQLPTGSIRSRGGVLAAPRVAGRCGVGVHRRTAAP